MKYNAKYFSDNMPEWKRKKDPILTRIFYRPVSFFFASICANLGIGANSVSFFSAIVAIVACALFLIDNSCCHIIAGILFNIWLVMDCIDGNLARSVKKEPFGEFADAMSSYLLVGLMGVAMGVAVYQDGGIIVDAGWHWIIVIGALFGSADSLMRLIHQKFLNTEHKMSEAGIIKVEDKKEETVEHSKSLIVRLDEELGIGGILPLAILLGVIFHFLDIVIFFCFAYYGGSAVIMTLKYVIKAINATKDWENKK